MRNLDAGQSIESMCCVQIRKLIYFDLKCYVNAKAKLELWRILQCTTSFLDNRLEIKLKNV